MKQTTDTQIAAEIAKIPASMRNNFLVRAAINSREELGADEQLELLQHINRNARRKNVDAVTFMGALQAGKKKNVVTSAKRKAK